MTLPSEMTPPNEMTPDNALREIAQARDLYSLEPTRIANLYETKLGILRESIVMTRPLGACLPRPIRVLYNSIRSAFEITDTLELYGQLCWDLSYAVQNGAVQTYIVSSSSGGF